MARNRLCRHACLADGDAVGVFHAIVERPTVDPVDFFGPERLEEIANCPHCTSLVLGVYGLVGDVANDTQLIAQLHYVTVDRDARDGKKPSERLADLSFV